MIPALSGTIRHYPAFSEMPIPGGVLQLCRIGAA